jgi:hypothetical protein
VWHTVDVQARRHVRNLPAHGQPITEVHAWLGDVNPSLLR